MQASRGYRENDLVFSRIDLMRYCSDTIRTGFRPKEKGFPVPSLFLLSLLLLGVSIDSVAQATAEVVAPVSLEVNSANGNNVAGLSPAEIRHAYGFDQIANQGEGQ